MSPMKREAAHHDEEFAGTMSIVQLARRWHLTRSEVRHMLGCGVLSFVQIRGKFRVRSEEVEQYERAHHDFPTPTSR